jgi:hypothetical protein
MILSLRSFREFAPDRGHGNGEFSDLFWDLGDARWGPGDYRGQPALFRFDATPERFPIVTTRGAAKRACHAVAAGIVALIRSVQTPPDGVE